MVPANRDIHRDRASSRARSLVTLSALAGFLATGCGTTTSLPSASPTSTGHPSAAPTPQPSDLLAGVTVSPGDELAAALDNNSLTVDLLQQFEVNRPNGNFVDSAYSLATALAMLELGAKGQTQTEIATVLHNAGVTPELQAAAWKQFDAALLATAVTDGISLDVANAVWLQEGLPFNTAFLNTLVNNFSAPSSQVDFNGDPEGAAAAVNRWVSDATHGTIPAVVAASDVQPCKVVLADAIYLDAHWLHQFDPSSTQTGPFFRPDNSQVSAELMHSELLTLPTYVGDGVTALEMPYVGGHYVADVVMPTSQPIGAFVADMAAATLTGIEQKLVPTNNVLLTLPKFDIASQESLVPLLTALGMTSAFGDAADFSGIDGHRDLHVGLVMQRARMQVDEVGTTAAAATVVGGLGGAGPPIQITNVVFDHPFLFVIRDITSGAIIFTSQVVDPTAAS